MKRRGVSLGLAAVRSGLPAQRAPSRSGAFLIFAADSGSPVSQQQFAPPAVTAYFDSLGQAIRPARGMSPLGGNVLSPRQGGNPQAGAFNRIPSARKSICKGWRTGELHASGQEREFARNFVIISSASRISGMRLPRVARVAAGVLRGARLRRP
jgi:hypothetical protein